MQFFSKCSVKGRVFAGKLFEIVRKFCYESVPLELPAFWTSFLELLEGHMYFSQRAQNLALVLIRLQLNALSALNLLSHFTTCSRFMTSYAFYDPSCRCASGNGEGHEAG